MIFPKTGHYLTYPAFLGPSGDSVFGNYFTKANPEYYDETYIFEAAKPYSFTVVFDTEGRHIDYSNETAHIDIWDGKDYFMAYRIFAFGLQGVPAAFAAHPAPVLRSQHEYIKQ